MGGGGGGGGGGWSLRTVRYFHFYNLFSRLPGR